MSQSSRLRIGLIGAGRIGKIHADNLSTRIPEAELCAIADIALPAAQELGSHLNVPTVVQDYQLLLRDPGIQAVVICSATDTHSVIMEQAAKAGKHIFCEKPIDFDLGKIDRALAAVDQAGVKLQVGFNRRFDPNFSRVHEVVSSGKIGQPQILRITSRDPAPPPLDYVKVSGGMFLDMTIHDFDMARYLVGSQVTRVYATGGVLIDQQIGRVGDLDTAVVVLNFDNGAIGVIDNSRQAVYGYDQRVEVFGSAGAVSVANNTPDNAVISDTVGVHGARPLYFFLERYVDSYRIEMQAFVDSVLQDKTPPATGQDGRVAVLLGLAAGRSLKEHRPVDVKEIA